MSFSGVPLALMLFRCWAKAGMDWRRMASAMPMKMLSTCVRGVSMESIFIVVLGSVCSMASDGAPYALWLQMCVYVCVCVWWDLGYLGLRIFSSLLKWGGGKLFTW